MMKRPAKPRRTTADRSTANRLLSLLKSGADARKPKIKRIRQSVKTRTYENDLKLSVAMDRMIRDLSA